MLTIFLFIGIASAFARLAFDKERNRVFWGVTGVVSYFLTQFIAGMIIVLINPELLTDGTIVMILNLVFGFLGVGIAYFILNRLPDLREVQDTDTDLLDSNLP
jgi:uncharacterized membrane protein